MNSLKGSVDTAEKPHAKYSASGSKRWLKCAGSTALIEQAPPGKDSKFAREGVRAHGVLEFLLRNRKNRKGAIAYLLKNHPQEMVDHAVFTLNYVEARLKEYPGAELIIEARCDLPVSEPDQFGTTDIAILDHFGRLIAIDYKYGAGIPVYITEKDGSENSQLVYYALGLAHKYDYNFLDVELVVVQPRRPIPVQGKPPGDVAERVRSHVLSIEALIEWVGIFERGIGAAKAARDKGPENFLLSGDHCQFCPAAVICPEIKNKALRQAQIDFDDGSPMTDAAPVASQKMTPEKLARYLDAAEKLEIWIKAAREYAEMILENGGSLPGWSLVETRAQRKWSDPEKIAKLAKGTIGLKAFTKPELLSPAQFEKLGTMAKVFVEKYSVSVSSGTKLGRVKEGEGGQKDAVKTTPKKSNQSRKSKKGK